jgi:parallel beta-helix repeat protein
MAGRVRFRIAIGLLAGLATSAAMACEPVTSVPATLSGGVYCLTGDVAAVGEPVFNLGNDTTLDCQGHRISDATSSTLFAVVANGDNVQVKNCIVEGFLTPFYLQVVTNFRVVGNTFLSPMHTAIYVKSSDEGLIANNTIRYPASRYAGYPGDWYGDSIGIEAIGPDVDIIHNTIVGAPPGDGSRWRSRYGIWSWDGVIAFNVVSGLVPDPLDRRWGITASQGAVVYRNVIVSVAAPLEASKDRGLYCGAYEPDAYPPLSAQNIVLGFAQPYSGCVNAGEVGLGAAVRRH